MNSSDMTLLEFPLHIEIDVSRIRNNIRLVKNHVGKNTKVILVAKSSMYNLGTPLVNRCYDLIDGIAIDNLASAYEHVRQGFEKNIYILCPVTPLWFDQIHLLEEHTNIISCLDSLEIARKLTQICNNEISVAVKINMGLNRFGIRPNELAAMMDILDNSPIRVDSIYSHFAGTTGRSLQYLKRKEASFLHTVSPYREQGIKVHIADSGCTVRKIGTDLDFVRVGLLPIGIDPVEVDHNTIAGLELGFKVCSIVLKVSNIKKGAELGYGGISLSDSTVATIAGGYAHGLPRDAITSGFALIGGVHCPYVCKPFMEYSIIDISTCELPVSVGDEVLIVGDSCSPTHLAGSADNIPEIFFTSLSHSVKRVLIT